MLLTQQNNTKADDEIKIFRFILRGFTGWTRSNNMLAEKIKSAKALIIGAYTPYGQIDGFTKALLERFWSFRHVNNLHQGKLCARVLTDLDPHVLDSTNQSLAIEIKEDEPMDPTCSK